MNEENSTIVIGAGISGSCTAYHLNKSGCDVTVIDEKKEDDIQIYLRNYLASFKIPTHFDFHREQLPRTASGKIYKLELRKEMEKKLSVSN